MPDLLYPPVIAASRLALGLLDLRITVGGARHMPTTGGAVLACNHTGYLDFLFAGFGALPSRRLVRFMCKQSVFRHWLGGPIMRGMHHIPVDRRSGLTSFQAATAALDAGEVIGVFPEATISRSLTVKEFKSGAARMAAASGTPLVPMAVWGSHRMWTKGHPRELTRRHLPVTVLVGEPLHPTTADDHTAVTAELRTRISTLVDTAQREYPDQPSGPEDTWWLPAHLGGSAPAPAPLQDGDAQPTQPKQP